MKIIHYSRDPIDNLDKSYDYQNTHTERTMWAKPSGLWVSIEDGYGWMDWCQENQFRIEQLTYQYQIELDWNSNIMKLETSDDIMNFTQEYWWNPSEWMRSMQLSGRDNIPKKSYPPCDKFEDYRGAIRWDLVKERYQGIIIAPYQWDCRLKLQTTWYYGWDCSSGCIWDISSIKNFVLIYAKSIKIPSIVQVEGKGISSMNAIECMQNSVTNINE